MDTTVYLIHCNNYRVIGTALMSDDLPGICASKEMRINDGYAVFAQAEGRAIADADGWTDPQTA